jgi:hypothetical protein
MKMGGVKGVTKLIANIKKAAKGKGAAKPLAAKFSRNLVKAGLYLQRESQHLCPIETGVLRNSAFTRKFGKGWKTKVIVGYTAAYGIYVHENLDALHGKAYNDFYNAGQAGRDATTGRFTKAKHKKKRPQEQAKFLEDAYKNNRGKIFVIIAKG